MNSKFNRRNFLKATALSGTFLGLSGLSLASNREEMYEKLERLSLPLPQTGKSVIGLKVPPIKPVKVGLIGLGNRGYNHVELINAMCPEKAKITALCDVRKECVEKSMALLKKSNTGQTPAEYSGNLDIWKEMVKRDDIDLVIISTPWEDHATMSVFSMQHGKHVAIEVPGAYTIDDCWKMVNTAEEMQKNCMMMENVCYGDEELWVLNMAMSGVFGTLTYGEAAYIHNLRDLLFGTEYYNKWRIRHNEKRDGNLYPTHGLGPVAQYMGIERGDRFDTLVSMSSIQASMTEESKNVDPLNEFYNHAYFKHGDMNNSLIKTNKGRTILLQHDVVTPRPYSRINALAGTKAYHEGYPSRLSVIGKGHKWLNQKDYADYKEKYKHPIWSKLKEQIAKYTTHGGMDFVMNYRLIDCFNNGWPLDMDVYDCASWSVITPLSEISVELGSIPMKFPDFTRGKWKEERKLGIFENV